MAKDASFRADDENVVSEQHYKAIVFPDDSLFPLAVTISESKRNSISKFTSPNAKGHLRVVRSFKDIEDIGYLSGKHLSQSSNDIADSTS